MINTTNEEIAHKIQAKLFNVQENIHLNYRTSDNNNCSILSIIAVLALNLCPYDTRQNYEKHFDQAALLLFEVVFDVGVTTTVPPTKLPGCHV